MSGTADRSVPGLHLDARRRAMLDEMGVKVWWPAQRASRGTDVADETDAAGRGDAAGASPRPHGAPSPVPPVPVARAPVAPPAPAAAPRAAQPARPGPDVLRPEPVPPRAPEAVPAPATRPASTPAPASRAVPGVAFEAPLRLYTVLDEDGIATPPRGGWLVVADMPPEADGDRSEPFAGEAGRLLDNMLRALRLHDGRTPVHLMRAHRAGPPAPSGRTPAAAPSTGTDFAALAGALAPRIVLAMGPLAAQSLLRSAEPLGRLRGRAEPLRIAPDGPLDGVPVVVTYPPAYLLRNPADKARAWADLCLAAERSGPSPA